MRHRHRNKDAHLLLLADWPLAATRSIDIKSGLRLTD
jgi:hypothetical protein